MLQLVIKYLIGPSCMMLWCLQTNLLFKHTSCFVGSTSCTWRILYLVYVWFLELFMYAIFCQSIKKKLLF